MKLNQTITWLKQGTFEAVVTLTDDNGNIVREFTRTYERSGSFFPAYNSLSYVIQPLHDVTITVSSDHKTFCRELTEVFESSRGMSMRLADLLEQNNITLLVDTEGEEQLNDTDTDTDVHMS